MNASGRLNTCKSRGSRVLVFYETGERVRNAYATYPLQENSPEKFGLILYSITDSHVFVIKVLTVKDGHA